MSDLPAAQQQALEHWANDAIAAGWLSETVPSTLSNAVVGAPSNMFGAQQRPLVVGLFGGTGVGKSTLLNRFAKEAVAQTSAERPTSRDITVYVHRSISVDKLPNNFPMHKMRTSLHGNQKYQHVMFIDMPDFDSVETANRDLVDAWLPHLDLVLYVVSPERYRDDQGWRLLLAHVTQHAWVFVMNHWDRGVPEQLADFSSQLAEAGLTNPLIFQTDSSSQSDATSDQFDSLQLLIQETSDESIIRSLEDLGVVARLKAMKALSDPWSKKLGQAETFQTLFENWTNHCTSHDSSLEQATGFKILQFSENYAIKKGFWLNRLRGDQAPPAQIPNPATIIDDSFLSRLDSSLADFINQQSQELALPIAAIKQSIAKPYANARRNFSATIISELDKSLALPGSAIQRALHKGLGILCIVLPLSAMIWIVWRVVIGFAEGGSNPAAYLGSSFAINASLLLGLSWLLPVFLHRKSKPSPVRAAQRGMKLGLQKALSNVQHAVSDGLSSLKKSSDALASSYQQLWQTLGTPNTEGLPEPVKRMLASELTENVHRSLDVRANTHSSTDKAPVS
ncbi:MAG: putative GTPase [Porticoccaceae bacterium]|jgi:predicted GTPase